MFGCGGAPLGANPLPVPGMYALFSTDGTINGAVAREILNALNEDHTAVDDRDTEFRLFSENTTNTNVQNLSNLTWRLTHVDGDRITLWAAGAYRNSQFAANAQTTTAHQYSGSAVRTNLTTDFNAIFNGFTAANQNNILTLGTTADNANTNDRIWLPTVNNVNTNWGLTADQRAFAANGFNANAWLRTHQTVGNPGVWVPEVPPSGWVPGTPAREAGWLHTGQVELCHTGWASHECWNEGIETVLRSTRTPNGGVIVLDSWGGLWDQWDRVMHVQSSVWQDAVPAIPGHWTNPGTPAHWNPAPINATVRHVTSAGAAAASQNTNVTTELSVRPALHVSLSQLEQYATPEITTVPRLAELISHVHHSNITLASFNGDAVAYREFRDAFFHAQNALFRLDTLSVGQVSRYARILHEALPG